MGFFYVVGSVATDHTQKAGAYVVCFLTVAPSGLELKYGLENQLDITEKAPVVQIIQVDFHFVRPNNIVIISLRINLLGKQFFFITVLDTCWAGNAWAELQNATVVAFQLVGIAGHIGAWTNKAHLSDKHIDQLGEAVHFAVA